MRVLGLICARGGSKGIPRKNIKPLNGQPLIAYSINAGLEAKQIERVVVSTDDEEIAEVAKEYGADVPFIRPAELAQDKSLQIDAIKHAIHFVEEQGDPYDVVCLLQPTCPMRSPEDIDNALTLLKDQKADTVISISNMKAYHPKTLYKQNPESKALEPFLEANQAGVLRQDFEDVFWRNGAIYAMKTKIITEDNSLYGAVVCGYEMPAERSVNIDEPLDWSIAEALMDTKV